MIATISRVIPSVDRRWLYLLAALLWSLVGLMLCRRAAGWLAPAATGHAAALALAGIGSGALIYRFKFARLADKNIKRINCLHERENILAFQSTKTYLLIVFMMGLGIVLRHSPIPKPTLAVLYIGIGLGLFLASLRYYACLLAARS